MFHWLRPRESLTPAELERGLSTMIAECVFGQTMLVLSTGPFLVAFALVMGGGNRLIGLLSAVGPVAQIIQIPAIYLVEGVRLRKVITMVSATVSRTALFAIAMLPWLAPQPYRIPLFMLFLGLHYGVGAISACAYNSWFRDFVPEDRLNAFIARRASIATLVGALLSLAGGVAVDLYRDYTGNAEGAYAVVFTAAGIAGMLSVFFIGKTPEPAMPAVERTGLLEMLWRPLRDTNFRNLLIFLACWSAAVNFAGPFFAVYMLQRLDLEMKWVMALSLVSQMTNVVFFGIWGKLADRFNNKSVLLFSVPVFFLSFLLWPFTTLPERHALTVPLLVAIHVLTGMTSAGVGLCAGNLAFKTAPYGRAASYLAVNALVSGVAATLAPILGGLAADAFSPYELRLTLSLSVWATGDVQMEFPTVDLKELDFVFVIGFVMGMYSLHRVLAIKEQGEVTEHVLRRALFGEMVRTVRQVSSMAGMRQVIAFPFAYLTGLRRYYR